MKLWELLIVTTSLLGNSSATIGGAGRDENSFDFVSGARNLQFSILINL